MKYIQTKPVILYVQVILLILILVGLLLLGTMKTWVPSTIVYILGGGGTHAPYSGEEYSLVQFEQELDTGWKVYSNKELGIQFNYPTFGLKDTVKPEVGQNEGSIEFYFEGSYQGRAIPPDTWAYNVIVQKKSPSTTLIDWITTNVSDCDYHIFSTHTTNSGFEYLLVTNDRSSTYEDECDPISFYSSTIQSPSGEYIVNVSNGHDGLLRDAVNFGTIIEILDTVEEI
jgi:hypothetical protein